jgi:hypothetical protein
MQEMFAQLKRKADAERALQTKITKKAENDARIGAKKAEQIKGRLDDLKRTTPAAKDSRIFPMNYAPIVIREGGDRGRASLSGAGQTLPSLPITCRSPWQLACGQVYRRAMTAADLRRLKIHGAASWTSMR